MLSTTEVSNRLRIDVPAAIADLFDAVWTFESKSLEEWPKLQRAAATLREICSPEFEKNFREVGPPFNGVRSRLSPVSYAGIRRASAHAVLLHVTQRIFLHFDSFEQSARSADDAQCHEMFRAARHGFESDLYDHAGFQQLVEECSTELELVAPQAVSAPPTAAAPPKLVSVRMKETLGTADATYYAGETYEVDALLADEWVRKGLATRPDPPARANAGIRGGPANEREEGIVKVLKQARGGRIVGEFIAERAGFEYDATFKLALASMVERGIIDNSRRQPPGQRRPAGYFLPV